MLAGFEDCIRRVTGGCRKVLLTIVPCFGVCVCVCVFCCRRCSRACASWTLRGRRQQRWRQLEGPSSACSCSVRAMRSTLPQLLPQRLPLGSS